MKKFGGYLLFFGIGSILLHLINMQFIILSWIDLWGESVAWTIRIGMIVAGGAMLLLANRNADAA
ncbi:MAG TPA: hypothetical protein VGH80_05725 [Xanthomonadaceae bacterium]|jgi:hypothetical protein